MIVFVKKPKNESDIYLDALDICYCKFPRVQPQEIRIGAPGQQNWEKRFDGWYVPLCYICRRAYTTDPDSSLERCQEICDDLNGIEINNKNITSNIFLSWDSKDMMQAIDLANELNELAINVNLIQAEKELGEYLPQLIDDKLKESEIAIILCSREYLENEQWAEMEKNAIVALKVLRKITILVILYEMTIEELASESPLLAPLTHIKCPTKSFDAKFVAKEVKKHLQKS